MEVIKINLFSGARSSDRPSQGRSTQSQFEFSRLRNLSIAAITSPSTPGNPAPELDARHLRLETKSEITVCTPTLKAPKHVAKRQQAVQKKIRDLSRLLQRIVDQVQDLEEAASKANDGIERELTSLTFLKAGVLVACSQKSATS